MPGRSAKKVTTPLVSGCGLDRRPQPSPRAEMIDRGKQPIQAVLNSRPLLQPSSLETAHALQIVQSPCVRLWSLDVCMRHLCGSQKPRVDGMTDCDELFFFEFEEKACPSVSTTSHKVRATGAEDHEIKPQPATKMHSQSQHRQTSTSYHMATRRVGRKQHLARWLQHVGSQRQAQKTWKSFCL